MGPRGHAPRHRPPWWPENEGWPPRGPLGEPGSHAMRGRFMRRLAFLFASFVVVIVAGATLLFWLAASALGVFEGSALGRGALVLVLLLLLVGLRFTSGAMRRLAAPVGDLIEAAGRVEAGDYAARVAERGPREVRALAHAFNAMTARLQASEEQRRRLLADVTHELRTPLTVVQGNLEGLLDGVYPADAAHLAPILEETRVLSRLLDDLRTLALAEAGALTLHREPTDLAVLVREALASFVPQADRAGVALADAVANDVPIVEVDPLRTREVLANLVANALRYTPRGGSVRVTVAAEDGRVAVSVRDTGAGIPADALPHVFDRFYKSTDSRGAGLGLAIAKSLVVAQGGEIDAHSVAGQGTEMRVTLPVAAPAA